MTKKIFAVIFILLLSGTIKGQINFVSSHLPIIIIDTEKKAITENIKIPAGMKIICNNENKLNYLTDPPSEYDGFIGIELRGSSTLRFPKKSYGIETRDSLGENLNVSILGMPPENDWILYAPYSDKTLIRNVLAYKLSRKMGQYAVRTRFCELFVNGDYKGLYVLMEKIKRDRNRVDIKNLEEKDAEGVALTGGYILQIDRSDSEGWFSDFLSQIDSNKKYFYQYYFPNHNSITDIQKIYIKNWIQKFEAIIDSEHVDHPDSGFVKYLDVDSFVDYLIISELSKNVDAYRLSTFIYKDRDDKDPRLKFGPVWDFNIAFGNADFYRGQFIDGFQITTELSDLYQTPFWFMKLFANALIFNKFSKRWNLLRNATFSTDSIIKYIDDNVTEIGSAVDRNFNKWNIIGKYVWPNPVVYNSYIQEVDQLKNWLTKRLNWIDSKVNKEYSSIDWVQKYQLSINSGKTTTILKEEFFVNKKNIDSIKFVPISNNLVINSSNNYAVFTNYGEEVKYFIATGFHNGNVVESSPLYSVRSDITVNKAESKTISNFSLQQNYPNPFNAKSNIIYQLSKSEFVKLSVYDVLGKQICILVNENQYPGQYSIVFDGTQIAGGIYFYTLQAGSFTETRKMILLK
jgi:hypothetical protein